MKDRGPFRITVCIGKGITAGQGIPNNGATAIVIGNRDARGRWGAVCRSASTSTSATAGTGGKCKKYTDNYRIIQGIHRHHSTPVLFAFICDAMPICSDGELLTGIVYADCRSIVPTQHNLKYDASYYEACKNLLRRISEGGFLYQLADKSKKIAIPGVKLLHSDNYRLTIEPQMTEAFVRCGTYSYPGNGVGKRFAATGPGAEKVEKMTNSLNLTRRWWWRGPAGALPDAAMFRQFVRLSRS